MRIWLDDMSRLDIPEAMVNLAHELVETNSLRSWFFALERLPPPFRKDAFSDMAVKMRKAGEDARLPTL
jgi:hypothetical protein